MPTISSTGSVQLPAFRRLADELRAQIVSGKHEPGDRLPSTGELALMWKASAFTVHSALVALAKEGWIDRINGSGTFVARRKRLYTCGGIYQAVDISLNSYPLFVRTLHAAVLNAFHRRGKQSQVFIDTRPEEQKHELLPTLRTAINECSIQGLVTIAMPPSALPQFVRLQFPTSFIFSGAPCRVAADMPDLLTRSLAHFKEAGCRSIGLLTTYFPGPSVSREFNQSFHNLAAAAGLATKPEWMTVTDGYVTEQASESFAYFEFKRLWKLGQPPDGLLVYPDSLLRGVMSAILEIGWQTVTSRMKLVMHRNLHNSVLCPFPVTWAISSEDEWADALVKLTEDQFEGRIASSVLIGFKLEKALPPASHEEAMKTVQFGA